DVQPDILVADRHLGDVSASGAARGDHLASRTRREGAHVNKAGSGIAAAPRLETAVLDAATLAMERRGLGHGDIAMVFLSGGSPAAAHETLHAVRRVTGARTVVGCSGVGVLTEERELEGASAAAVLVIRDERLVARALSLENLAGGDTDPAREITDSA